MQQQVPLWIGGRTPRSLRRAITLGDGWVPFGLGLSDLADLLAGVELRDNFQVVLSPGRPVDPLGDRQATADRLARVRSAGATLVSTAVHATSVDHYCEQLEALATIDREIG